jgi:hypothetical protein
MPMLGARCRSAGRNPAVTEGIAGGPPASALAIVPDERSHFSAYFFRNDLRRRRKASRKPASRLGVKRAVGTAKLMAPWNFDSPRTAVAIAVIPNVNSSRE